MGDIIKYYSIWKENVKKNSFDKLSSNKKCDVLIILSRRNMSSHAL